MSGVIRMTRNNRERLLCDEDLFKKVVKQGFQNRRKTLRNALKPLNLPAQVLSLPQLDLRAEQLSVEDFISLTLQIEKDGGAVRRI
jgi:16S rRNA (adenine1518-N6/adenine1519-N6)-dimethyltransferase